MGGRGLGERCRDGWCVWRGGWGGAAGMTHTHTLMEVGREGRGALDPRHILYSPHHCRVPPHTHRSPSLLLPVRSFINFTVHLIFPRR